MAGSLKNYSDSSDMMNTWIKNIAPKYFNFDVTLS